MKGLIIEILISDKRTKKAFQKLEGLRSCFPKKLPRCGDSYRWRTDNTYRLLPDKIQFRYTEQRKHYFQEQVNQQIQQSKCCALPFGNSPS